MEGHSQARSVNLISIFLAERSNTDVSMSWEDVGPTKCKTLMEVVHLENVENEEMRAGVTITSVAEFQRQMGRSALQGQHRIKVSFSLIIDGNN